MTQEFLKLDGSLGEGGGQVVRISLCLSALFGIPVEINNIRAGRPKQGLSAQHLKGVELLRDMCNAQVTGAHLGSTRLTFNPGSLQYKKQEFSVDIGTAGCIPLLIQIALPCALFASKEATYILKGGTNVPFGPQIEYVDNIFRPMLNMFGADFGVNVVRKGYYPRGGGEVHLYVNPIIRLKGINLIQVGDPISIKGLSFVAGPTIREAETMTNNANSTIVGELMRRDIKVPPIFIQTYQEQKFIAPGKGSGINLWCITSTGCRLGGSALGSKQQTPIPPGTEAANQLLNSMLNDACVDEYLQDQIIILMVLAKGASKVKVGKKPLTCHTETAKQVAEIMLGSRGLRFSMSQDNDGSHILECNGLGLINKYL